MTAALQELWETLWHRQDYFFTLFSEHLLISFLALFLVTVFGIAIGVWVFYSAKARTIILPAVNFLYTIPSIAMFGLLIPLVGIGLKNALIVLILYGLLPIVRNTYSGLKEVPVELVDAAKGLGATPKQLFKQVYFPLALPMILSSLRVTAVMVIALTGLAALIGAGGLGQAIFRGLNTMNTPLIVIGSLGISLFAILGDKFVGVFEKNNHLQRMVARNATAPQKKFVLLNSVFLVAALVAALVYTNPFKQTLNNTAGKSQSKQADIITVASKPTSEQFILGEIIAQSIENHTNLQVKRQFGIGGGTTNIHPAMLAGDIDMYVEYTGTSWLNVLKEASIPNQPIPFEALQSKYSQKFGLTWLGLLGFNNTYAMAISKADAVAKNIVTVSDLAKHSQDFEFGAEFDFFERPDAYQGLIKVYPLQFKKLHEMDINLRYKAMEDGKVNAIDAFTTDAQIDALQLQVLVDDKHFFPDYKAGIVIRDAVLKKHPVLKPLLSKLNDSISTDTMRKMNYAVEVEKKTAKQVASEFLQGLTTQQTSDEVSHDE